MPTIIPFEPSNARYRFGTSLGSFHVWFDVHYNSRDRAWYFDLRDDTDDAVIIAGVKVVLGVNFGRRSAHPLFKSNLLRAIDTTRSGRDATFDDLGTRVQVLHYTLDELLGVT